MEEIPKVCTKSNCFWCSETGTENGTEIGLGVKKKFLPKCCSTMIFGKLNVFQTLKRLFNVILMRKKVNLRL